MIPEIQEAMVDFNWDAEPQITFISPYRCGEYHSKTDVNTGKKIWFQWSCKKYHDCPICAKTKQGEFKKRLEDIYHSDKPIRVILHNSPIKDLNEDYPDRLHIPFTEKEYYSLVESDGEEGQPLTPELIEKLSLLAVAPKGKRISGNLGKKASTPPSKEEKSEILLEDSSAQIERRVYKFVSKDGENFEDMKTLELIESKVIEKTKHLNPKSVGEVEEAIKEVEQANEEVAKEYDLEILFLYRESVVVYIDKVDWSERIKWLENIQKTRSKNLEYTT